ncbi:integrin alpha-9-like [Acanthaster planci]|uniref:Integrin alpha-9-like n=1 Tax=Acanthaster planci TaxID=133434 RepID=A0A8B7XV41_ACAPL|nr:integrin alpha-9-like [Acanthaster planci]XP_022083764.1 integrin alpha-9-like [Acanthaster planci]
MRIRWQIGRSSGMTRFVFSLAASAVVFLLVAVRHFATGCNIDDSPDKIITFNGEPGSYFGYTVQQHRNIAGAWVLVGAPRGQSSSQSSIDRPGALYRCQANRPHNCYEVTLDQSDGNEDSPQDKIVEVKDNQWLGVSLTRQPTDGRDAYVTVCGHLSANDNYFVRPEPTESEEERNVRVDRYVNGICYTIDSDFNANSVVKMRPCHDELQVNGTFRYHSHCQAGISATYNMDGSRLILGAVGSYEWNGTTIEATRQASNFRYNVGQLSDWGVPSKGRTEYRGYSVSTGKFLTVDTEQGVTGAPRSQQIGKVTIYDLETFQVYTELLGEMMSTYYGCAVQGVDLNGDGLSDLLVGAPLYSDVMDEGRVYVYINKGEARMEQLSFKLEGSNAVGGRFGTSIAYIKDVNLDGFNDVAIAAPYEDENTGAVYIYRGDRTGIQRRYSQRLAARDLLPGVTSFGSSIAGGMDIDFNFYPDLVVGSYANDEVYMFKTLPVVKLRVWIEVSPETLDPEFNNCELGGRKITCLTVKACFDYTDVHGLPDKIKFDYTLEVDVLKTDLSATPRFFFQGEAGQQINSVAATIELTKSQPSCYPRFVYLKSEARDFLTPVRFLLTYDIWDYPDEPPRRGDEVSSPFPGGLPPVIDNPSCSNGTAEKTVLFIQDCGNDSICQTDLRVIADLFLSSGNPYITLGGDGVVYLMVQVQNLGEEAHQAELLISHSREIVFESLESRTVECITDRLGARTCSSDNVVTCEPREAINETAEVLCSLGNPMRSRTVNILRMRFDVGGMSYGRRIVDFTAKATTLSVEQNNTLTDNTDTVSLPVRIVADVVARGAVQPEQLFYFPDNETIDGKTPDKEALLRAALEAAGILEGEVTSTDKAIGPSFAHAYEARNLGPGRLPLDSIITIQLPWRAPNGDWLIFIQNIQLNGEGLCNGESILELQRTQMREHYIGQTGTLSNTPHEIPPSSGDGSDNREIGCGNTLCVTITCGIKGPIIAGQGAVVDMDAVLWQRTLIDNNLGSVNLVSTATVSVQDTNHSHTQPDGGMPDTTELRTMVFIEEVPKKPVEPWIIAVSTLGGILGLIFLILALWKLGFFKRREKDKLEKAMENGL